MPLVKEPPEPISEYNLSFKLPHTPDNEKLLKDLKIMAAKDGFSFSNLVRFALQEYHERHSPGNPQLVLGHWSDNLPFPKTLEKRKTRAEHEEEQIQRLLKRSKMLPPLKPIDKARRPIARS